MAGQYHDLAEDKKVFSLEEIDLSLTYSYANYLTWLFDDRVELIKGKVFKMGPAPSPMHQEISASISSALYSFLKDKPCKIYYAPFDVLFPKESKADKDIYTVLQPDICVICDPAKIDGRGCVGAPDIVIEILSPGNNRTELLNKYNIYEEFGVEEYWVVSPGDKTLLKHTLNVKGKYQASKLFTISEKVYSDELPGFELDLDAVFED
ncbi:Uma2 family endonuclease [Daejeonella sp.]|uniref:Uma2 family endonuclease n=1 Tax=Daejeonella sp. TaxID=2805397 RepID=UPI002723F334|nr:Uma2 family endonuclease [Daejeonella sp.]MDO8993251.1 Uma2 family endonuclease [Daejeonella sp.]MDP2414628.1 Uma2 family endonuclease [Daejeonella sp.]